MKCGADFDFAVERQLEVNLEERAGAWRENASGPAGRGGMSGGRTREFVGARDQTLRVWLISGVASRLFGNPKGI